MREVKKKFKIDVYGYTLNVVCTDDIQQSCKKIIKSNDDMEDYSGLFTYGSRNIYQMYIFIQLDKYSKKGTPAHEAFHATCHIMKNSGCPLDESSEEAYAYLLGYITEKVLDTIKLFENKFGI